MSSYPELGRGQRMTPADQQRVGAELLAKYTAGSSIRELCAETGYSIGRVRRLLESGGVEYRKRGGARRRGSASSS